MWCVLKHCIGRVGGWARDMTFVMFSLQSSVHSSTSDTADEKKDNITLYNGGNHGHSEQLCWGVQVWYGYTCYVIKSLFSEKKT